MLGKSTNTNELFVKKNNLAMLDYFSNANNIKKLTKSCF